MLSVPLRRRKPTTWFVNSMSDLFGEGVSDGFILDVFRIIAECPIHTFQILTKRPTRMRAWFERWADVDEEGSTRSWRAGRRLCVRPTRLSGLTSSPR